MPNKKFLKSLQKECERMVHIKTASAYGCFPVRGRKVDTAYREPEMVPNLLYTPKNQFTV